MADVEKRIALTKKIAYLEDTLEILEDITLKAFTVEGNSGSINLGELKVCLRDYMEAELRQLKGQLLSDYYQNNPAEALTEGIRLSEEEFFNKTFHVEGQVD